MTEPTFLWHDYETFGSLTRPWDRPGSVAPRRARPSHFAAIRTSLDLEEIGDPTVLRCRPSLEEPPSVDACLVTGVVPQDNLDALEEHVFFERVVALFDRRETCGVGWNSLGYDDLVTRFGLWRNLMPVYAREHQRGNTRWDLLPVFRLAFATRPDALEWPLVEGVPSLRLDEVAAANGVQDHEAHDALGDVRATLALARILRARLPRLWEHALSLRNPGTVAAIVDAGKPYVLSDRGIGPQRGHATVALTLIGDRRQRVAIDLHSDPARILELDPSRVRERMYGRADDEEPVPIRTLRTNQFPMVAPVSVLDGEEGWSRLGLGKEACRERLAFIEENRAELLPRLEDVLGPYPEEEGQDAEEELYGGAFVQDELWRAIADAKEAGSLALQRLEQRVSDPRIVELLFRYRARVHPDALEGHEAERWESYLRDRLTAPGVTGTPRLEEALASIQQRRSGDDDPVVLDRVESWMQQLAARSHVEVVGRS